MQFGIISLFILGVNTGLDILTGNYSAAKIMGQINLTDPYAMLQMLATGYMPVAELWIGFVTVLVFYAIIGSRMFCSWVCPLNMITDWAALTQRKLKIKPLIKTLDERNLRYIRYYVLLLGLLMSAAMGKAAFEAINPIGMWHRSLIYGFGFGSTVVVIIFLFDLLVLNHGWCGHLCPLGATYAALGRFKMLKVSHNKDACTLCMKCKHVCPEPQVLGIIGKESGRVKSGECTNCGYCIDVCEDDALRFKILK